MPAAKSKAKKTRTKSKPVKVPDKAPELPVIPTYIPEILAPSGQALELRQQHYLQELGEIPHTYETWLATLSKAKQLRIRNRINRTKHGLHAVAPLTCTGPGGCPFIDACPIPDRSPAGVVDWGPDTDYPIGQACVLEGEYIVQRVGEYFVHLDVDPHNPIERSIVQELALIDLQKNRALLILSHGDKEGFGRDFMHVDESITGYDEQGGELVSRTTKIHPVLEYVDKLERRREKWLDKLMETRKAKADWAAKMGNNQAESKILNEIAEMRKVVTTMLSAREIPLLEEDDEGIGLDEAM